MTSEQARQAEAAGAVFATVFAAAKSVMPMIKDEPRISAAFRRVLIAFEFYLDGREGWDADRVRLAIAAANLQATGFIENPTREEAEHWLAELR